MVNEIQRDEILKLTYALTREDNLPKSGSEQEEMLCLVMDRILLANIADDITIEKIIKELNNLRIQVPQMTIEDLLKNNYKINENHYIRKTFEDYEKALDFKKKQDNDYNNRKILYDNLVSEFVEHCKKSFKTNEIDIQIANKILSQYIDSDFSGTNNDYLIYLKNFIDKIYNEGNEKYINLINEISVANITLRYIIPNDDFTNFHVYIDTPEMLKRLGYWGKEAQEIYKDFFEKLIELKAVINIFEHTQKEMAGIIEGLNRNFKFKNYTIPFLSNYLQAINDENEKDTQFQCPKLNSEWLKNEIEALNIKIIPKPGLENKEQWNKQIFNEKSLKQCLTTAYTGGNVIKEPWKLERRINADIDSIIAVAMLRQNNDDNRYIFLTGNKAMIEIANSEFKKVLTSSPNVFLLENIIHFARKLISRDSNKLIGKYIRLMLLDALSIDDNFIRKLNYHLNYLTKIKPEIDAIWVSNPDITHEILTEYIISGKKDDELQKIIESIMDQKNYSLQYDEAKQKLDSKQKDIDELEKQLANEQQKREQMELELNKREEERKNKFIDQLKNKFIIKIKYLFYRFKNKDGTIEDYIKEFHWSNFDISFPK